jgi:GTP-binding protein
MLDLAASRSVPVHILLTKADKLGRGAGLQTLAKVQKAVGDGVTAQLFSALSGAGVAEARGAMLRLLAATPERAAPDGPTAPAAK